MFLNAASSNNQDWYESMVCLPANCTTDQIIASLTQQGDVFKFLMALYVPLRCVSIRMQGIVLCFCQVCAYTPACVYIQHAISYSHLFSASQIDVCLNMTYMLCMRSYANACRQRVAARGLSGGLSCPPAAVPISAHCIYRCFDCVYACSYVVPIYPICPELDGGSWSNGGIATLVLCCVLFALLIVATLYECFRVGSWLRVLVCMYVCMHAI